MNSPIQNLKQILLFLPYLFVLLSCSDKHEYSSDIEQIFPGRWRIVSFNVEPGSDGITYQGQTFFQDTILTDIGEIEIQPFEFEVRNSGSPVSYDVDCTVKIGDEEFPYRIDHMYVWGDDMLGDFEINLPPGAHPISTPGEEFIWSSNIFNRNYFIIIEDANHLRFDNGTSNRSQVIELEKIQ